MRVLALSCQRLTLRAFKLCQNRFSATRIFSAQHGEGSRRKWHATRIMAEKLGPWRTRVLSSPCHSRVDRNAFARRWCTLGNSSSCNRRRRALRTELPPRQRLQPRFARSCSSSMMPSASLTRKILATLVSSLQRTETFWPTHSAKASIHGTQTTRSMLPCSRA